jgi:hypothetical protein
MMPTMEQWLDQWPAHPIGEPVDAALTVRAVRVERESQLTEAVSR